MIKSPGCSLAINAMQELADSEYLINWERSSESTRQVRYFSNSSSETPTH